MCVCVKFLFHREGRSVMSQQGDGASSIRNHKVSIYPVNFEVIKCGVIIQRHYRQVRY